ncbi:MAG: leucine-rich repeat domain-containing protein, partial [Clostridiales bacterium]|nr:leucine-rich repeat domain-containing protein [Clostridiales bacterium]
MLLSVFSVVPFTVSAAETASADEAGTASDDYEYEILTDGTAEITGYTGEATDLEITSAIDGYTVTSIGDSAFEDCDSLTSVTIPDSVTSIG